MAKRDKYVAAVASAFAGAPLSALAEGLAWYTREHERILGLPEVAGRDSTSVFAATAILSPGISWDWNLRSLQAICNGVTKGLPAYASNVKKAQLALDRPDLAEALVGGKKVTAFFNNLRDPNNSKSVTVDRHILRTLWPRYSLETLGKWVGREGTYESITKAFQEVANAYNLYPHQVQATVWVLARSAT